MATDVRPVNTEDVDRVRAHTSPKVQDKLDHQLSERLHQISEQGPGAIDRRLVELDDESDIERVLEGNAAGLALLGLTLGATTSRRWLLLPGVVLPFLLQHALQGWCPPVALLRRLGFRTRLEIDAERTALKAMRGDFAGLPGVPADIARILEAVRR